MTESEKKPFPSPESDFFDRPGGHGTARIVFACLTLAFIAWTLCAAYADVTRVTSDRDIRVTAAENGLCADGVSVQPCKGSTVQTQPPKPEPPATGEKKQ